MYRSRHWEGRGTVLAFVTQMTSPGLTVSRPHSPPRGGWCPHLLTPVPRSSPTGPGVLQRLRTSWHRFPGSLGRSPPAYTSSRAAWATSISGRQRISALSATRPCFVMTCPAHQRSPPLSDRPPLLMLFPPPSSSSTHGPGNVRGESPIPQGFLIQQVWGGA